MGSLFLLANFLKSGRTLATGFVQPIPTSHIKLTLYRDVCTGTAPATAPLPTAAASYVPNSYFPFPYAPATFHNSAACSSAVSQCSVNFAACMTDLQEGNGYAVTIIVPGGGGTTVGAETSVGASATPICSSLSSVACSGLQSTQCAQYGTANMAALPRQTMACIVGVAAGLGAVVLGAF